MPFDFDQYLLLVSSGDEDSGSEREMDGTEARELWRQRDTSVKTASIMWSELTPNTRDNVRNTMKCELLTYKKNRGSSQQKCNSPKMQRRSNACPDGNRNTESSVHLVLPEKSVSETGIKNIVITTREQCSSPTVNLRRVRSVGPGEGKTRSPAMNRKAKNRRRSVTFADDMGLPLFTVKSFIKVDREASPDLYGKSPSADRTPSLTTSPTVPIRRRNVNLCLPTMLPTVQLKPTFPQPVAQSDFKERLLENNVMLENVFVQGSNILGTVIVRDLDYEKKVRIRCTCDSWNNYGDIDATYLHKDPVTAEDKFLFKLSFEHATVFSFEFAVCYEVSGQQYWDNNGGQNYKFVCHILPGL